jgi:fructose-bisphosphate aldolase, class I
MSFGWAHKRRMCKLRTARDSYRFLALDHGLSHGSIEGIEDLHQTINKGIASGFGAVVVTLGMLRWLPPSLPCGIIIQSFGLPATTKNQLPKVPLACIEDFVRFAPDAIAVQFDPFSKQGLSLISDVSKTIETLLRYGIPTLTMINVHHAASYSIDRLRLAVRICTELGSSFIKLPIPPTYSEEDIGKIKMLSVNSPPILLAGGMLRSDFTKILEDSTRMGFSGVCLGRNYFQAPNAQTIATALVSCYP